jgi:CheY-like chemotaxis protein
LLKDAVGETIEVSLSVQSAVFSIRIDPGQFEIAVLNLALNARDAMPNGGRLRIETQNSTIDVGKAASLAISPGEYVAVEVSDDGIGMPGDVAARAFEPFFTTKETGKGSGLGLSMVYGFVRQSDGGVEIESVKNVGTTVRLYFPRVQQAGPSEKLPAAVRPRAAGKCAILVVEDQDEIRHLVAECLEECGHKVRGTPDAKEALEILSQRGIDILLTDIILPGIDGLDLVREARKLAPDLRVVMMSGNVDENYVKASSVDRFVFLSKPFRPSDLMRTIDELVETACQDSRHRLA